MKSLSERLLEKLDNFTFSRDDELWEMANLGTKRTGLPVYVFVSVKMHSAGPRIKVGRTRDSFRNKRENFSVSISNNPSVVAGSPKGIVDDSELNLVFKWVRENLNTLIEYWNNDLDTDDMIDKIKKV